MAGTDADDAGRILEGEIDVMDVEQDRDVHILVNAGKVTHDDVGHDRIQRRDRLIGQDDRRILGQGAGQGYTLHLAAGQFVAAGICLVKDLDLVEVFECLHLLFLGIDAEEHLVPRHVRDIGSKNVVNDGGTGDQVERLEDHADVAAQILSLEGHDVGAVNNELAVSDVDHAVDGADQRRFACTGEADDGDEFALIDLEVYMLEALGSVGICFGYVFKLNHVLSPAVIHFNL